MHDSIDTDDTVYIEKLPVMVNLCTDRRYNTVLAIGYYQNMMSLTTCRHQDNIFRVDWSFFWLFLHEECVTLRANSGKFTNSINSYLV